MGEPKPLAPSVGPEATGGSFPAYHGVPRTVRVRTRCPFLAA